MVIKNWYLFAVTFLVFSLQGHPPHQVFVTEGYWISPSNPQLVEVLKNNPEITLDHPSREGIEVYGPSGLSSYLKMLAHNYSFSYQNLQSNLIKAEDYPSFSDMKNKLLSLQKQFPTLMKILTLGKTSKNQELFMVKITKDVEANSQRPQVKYIANMHGDEITGREMMVRLIEDLLNHYQSDADIQDLVDNTQIFIMPSMNPDGASLRRRGNDNYTDLNRNFPDFTTSDNQNEERDREIETQVVMQFQKSHQCALSANFHGGTQVVNYPWDAQSAAHPFEDLVKEISLEYASRVPGMYNSSEFPGGIVNGYAWYEVKGGMQDWSYYWHNDLQVTIEVSHQKWPSYSTMNQFYQDNRLSLITFLKRVHQGKGFIFKDRLALKGTVKIYKIDKEAPNYLGEFFFHHGEFYKVLPEGHYRFEIKTSEGETKSLALSVENKIQQDGLGYISL